MCAKHVGSKSFQILIIMSAKKGKYKYCYVPNCSTYTIRGLYTIPEHPIRRQAWIDVCKFPDNTPKGTLVCWKHFQKNDFKSDIDYENLSTCHFPRIHTSTVPSLLLPGSENEPESLLPDLSNSDEVSLDEVSLDEVIESSVSNNPITVVNKYLRVQSVILLKNRNN